MLQPTRDFSIAEDSIAEEDEHIIAETCQQMSGASMTGFQQTSQSDQLEQKSSRRPSKRTSIFQKFNNRFLPVSLTALNEEPENGGTISEEDHKIAIEELQAKLDESVAMVDALKSEVKHVRSYYGNRIPKIETENEVLRQQNEFISAENDELANDLYDLVQENEAVVNDLEKAEHDLLNYKTQARKYSEENESLLRQLEEFSAVVSPSSATTSWFSQKPTLTTKDIILSAEDREDASFNDKIAHLQLKKNLSGCLSDIEEMRHENINLCEERDNWMERYDVLLKEIKEMRIQSKSVVTSGINGLQSEQNSSSDGGMNKKDRMIENFVKKLSELAQDDEDLERHDGNHEKGRVKIAASRRVSERRSSAVTMRVKTRMSKRWSMKGPILLDLPEEEILALVEED
mmetsp:Transcript_10471/g.12742  ORF Transcript_10471/g.12742 Transcript_10471/m.12742 type:complete len:403 (+) Transcript_10471:34-1242(+)